MALSTLDNGIYAISKPGDQLATADNNSSGTKVTVLPLNGEPGAQEWVIERLPNGNVTIRNLNSKLFLSFDGEPHINKPIIIGGEPQEWSLRQVPNGDSELPAYFVVVPGGPIDGGELVFDMSLLRIFPPMTALRPLTNLDIPTQTWRFEKHAD